MKSDTITSEQFFSSNGNVRFTDNKPKTAFNFQKKIIKRNTEKRTSTMGVGILLSSFILMIAGAFSVYEMQTDFDQFHVDRIDSTFGFCFLILTLFLLFFQVSVFLYNLYLYFKYKPIESVNDDLLPTVTVIVPAYNESKQVWDTLMSLSLSDFPEQKMQILAVDDGSKDDTWYWMQQAKLKLGDRLTIFKQPENKGKRHALYRGFQLGTGEVFVTVDSDSIVKKDTLRNLVSPFVTDKNCGAVAGNVQVLNNSKAIIPKMLNVSFVMSFEFMRSAESKLNSVLCTPGAAAAYSRKAVFGCLEDWINQTFMGEPSDIGEDRAMTNMILKQGHHVLFQRNAIVLTNVPEEYTGLYKMFIRWGRSNVRENIMMSQYVFKNFRKGTKFGTRLLFLNQSLRIIMTYPLLVFMLFLIIMHPLLFLSSTLLGILIVSSFSVFFYAKRYNLSESFWAYSYSIFYTFSLFWIAPYALVTANKRGWLTRGLSEVK
ncbi:glycosyltransferase [Flavobacterium sp.]|uniref:glycosyltransferase n=1 Tax=Flavobacterium sp. TaxID=239 RepID=UPI003C4F95E4